MAITVSDIKLLASDRMTDETDGGGPMSGNALQDGTENNIFPDVSSTDRAFGRLGLRKVWPAVLNAGTDTLLGAHVILDDMPDDAAVSAFAFASLGASENRDDAAARLEVSHWEPLGAEGLQWANAPHLGARIKSALGVVPVTVGSVIYRLESGPQWVSPVLVTGVTEVLSGDGSFAEGFTSTAVGDRVFSVTYDGAFSPLNPTATHSARLGVPSTTSPRLASTRPVTGTLSIGATYCEVDTLLAPVVPKNIGSPPGTSSQIDIDPSGVLPAGRAVAFRSNDGLVIHHTAEVAAAVYANTNTINCGRTGLASVRLIGGNGVSIPTGWTVNLATGIVTVNDISGWNQTAPGVRVRHTIEEVVGCARTSYPEVTGGSGGTGDASATAPITLIDGLQMYCGKPNVGSIRVISKTGQDITNLRFASTEFVSIPWFGIDLAAGSAGFHAYGGTPLGTSVAAFIASHSPVTLVSSGSFSSVGVASIAQTTLNRITFNRALTKAFPSGTLISSMLLLGDLQARAGASFSQESWTAVWADERIGSAIAPQYQQVANPIAVTNAGAISERWALIFTSSTAFRLVGESTGQIATGDINSNLSPINPATSVPYFTVAATGWGSGWSAGNVLRFNTTGANGPTWVARSVIPSAPNSTPDSITIAVRGDIDA